MIFKAITKVIAEFCHKNEEDITLATNLTRDLGLKRFHVHDLTYEIEDVFEIRVPDEEIDQFETVADIVNYVENH